MFVSFTSQRDSMWKLGGRITYSSTLFCLIFSWRGVQLGVGYGYGFEGNQKLPRNLRDFPEQFPENDAGPRSPTHVQYHQPWHFTETDVTHYGQLQRQHAHHHHHDSPQQCHHPYHHPHHWPRPHSGQQQRPWWSDPMLVNSVEITEISVKLVNLKNSVKFSKIQWDSNLLKFLKLTMYVIYG